MGLAMVLYMLGCNLQESPDRGVECQPVWCLPSLPYEYFVINNTGNFISLKYEARVFGPNSPEPGVCPECRLFETEYEHILRQNDFAHVSDFLYFQLNDQQNSTTALGVYDSLGNKLLDILDGNGLYELTTNASNDVQAIKLAEEFEPIDCGLELCPKYNRPFDVTFTSASPSRIAVSADFVSWPCVESPNGGVGTCFPRSIAQSRAEAFELDFGDQRNFKHLADEMRFSYGLMEYVVSTREDPAIGGKISVTLFENSAEIEFQD